MNLSIIIPSYNAADTLAVQLEALSKQVWPKPWEVLVVDNGSTDATRAVAAAYGHKLPHLRIVDASAVQGPAHARNRGAEEAGGELLLFCDADDEVADGWLPAMGAALERHGFVTCRFEATKLSASWAIAARGCPQETGIQTYDYPSFLPHAASAALGIRRDLHMAVGGFDESMPMLEDTDYCWRVQLQGTPLVFVDDALIHYRMRGSISKMLRQARLWGEYNVYLYKKFRPFGMQKLSKKTGLIKTWRLLRQMPRGLSNPRQRYTWLWQFNWQVGRAVGSLKYGVFAL
jgi:GT2 family glycosyltransferase